MDSSGALRPLDESLLRELPQLSLRIAPLREPVSSRTLSVPSPLEPNASGTRDSQAISKSTNSNANISPNPKAGLPTVKEFLNAARIKKTEPPATDSQSNVEPPPKPILPAFVNLRAIERFPFSSSFDDDALHGQRKRRRVDFQAESFSEHLQLPIPQAQKEQRPPPFGPFAILNGLNEPPPNAAILPPIEAGSSITQLLTKPTRNDATVVDLGSLVSTGGTLAEGQIVERKEARIEELLDTTLDEDDDDDNDHENDDVQRIILHDPEKVPQMTVDKREALQEQSTMATPALAIDEPLPPKTRGRSRKNLRRWTEQETTDLLRGVVKCGIGNWTTILAQPELQFNKRTASNLKDRFRVCCPWAYRASDPNEARKRLRDNLASALLKSQTQDSDGNPGKIHLPQPSLMNASSEPNSGSGSPSNSSHRPSDSSVSSVAPETDNGKTPQRTFPSGKAPSSLSNKSHTTLASLGIPEPHMTMKSKRRSRCPFTSAEDEALLKGYAVHGFQWTLIQQDKRLNLGHRRATDLRDRFRTKFPHAYREGGSVSGKAIHTQNNTQSLAASVSESRPRDHPPSNDSTPTKPCAAGHRRPNMHSRHASTASNSNPGSIDSAFLPPPQSLSELSAANTVPGMLSFPMDESSTGGASSPWEDNTLAPMIWDDLG
ncbi:hypothetical protein N7462_001783 [Penicillium macrosclerotiorum]|uniref:uncharacterized protein n=1 Tax=Penicillium macrosclerotiorum TaxID=303699 RepID=UPI0025492D00|nr:uncharacterized protein N7462_001783 [Penicillium macrosclerotiorum]KAJ5692360.1 hypothetical protein N7462_001783 [Penicillium macrosclerotiorum]